MNQCKVIFFYIFYSFFVLCFIDYKKKEIFQKEINENNKLNEKLLKESIYSGPSDTNAIYEIYGNHIYEFLIFSKTQPYHQHVYSFQIQQNLNRGYIGRRGEWSDTFGYICGFKMRMNVRDYYGVQVLHCHFLGHED